MSNKKVVHTDDVTSVTNWDLPDFEDEDSDAQRKKELAQRTQDAAKAEALKKQARFGNKVNHTEEFTRVGIWDESEFQPDEEREIIDPRKASAKVYTQEEFGLLEEDKKLFTKVTATEEFTRIALWDLPIFEVESKGPPIEVRPEKVKMPTAEELEAVQESARQEAYSEGLAQGKADGFEQGKQEGHQAGLEEGRAEGREQAYNEVKAQLEAQVEQLKALCGSLSEPLKTLDDSIEQELVAVAMSVAKHLVRRELHTDPGQVVAAVRQAVSILPINNRNIRVYLHPEDAALVKESLSVSEQAEDEQRWKIVEDPALTRGGCNVESELSRIDATVETRLAAIIAQALGGERESDSE